MTGEESVVQLIRLSDGLGVLQQTCEAGLLVLKVRDSVGGGVPRSRGCIHGDKSTPCCRGDKFERGWVC